MGFAAETAAKRSMKPVKAHGNIGSFKKRERTELSSMKGSKTFHDPHIEILCYCRVTEGFAAVYSSHRMMSSARISFSVALSIFPPSSQSVNPAKSAD